MKLTLIKLAAEDEQRLERVAGHEAGHAVIAAAYGLNPRAFVGGPLSGICTYQAGTTFENAATAWGGVLAEDWRGPRNPARTLPNVKCTSASFGEYLREMLFGGGVDELVRFAAADVQMICRDERKHETAHAAFDILARRRDQLEWWTELLMNESRERVRAAVLRDDFAADERECLASVGGR